MLFRCNILVVHHSKCILTYSGKIYDSRDVLHLPLGTPLLRSSVWGLIIQFIGISVPSVVECNKPTYRQDIFLTKWNLLIIATIWKSGVICHILQQMSQKQTWRYFYYVLILLDFIQSLLSFYIHQGTFSDGSARFFSALLSLNQTGRSYLSNDNVEVLTHCHQCIF